MIAESPLTVFMSPEMAVDGKWREIFKVYEELGTLHLTMVSLQ